MADFAGDLKYSKNSAIAYGAFCVVLSMALLFVKQLDAFGGAAWMLLTYAIGPLLFAYAGFLAAKAGKALVDSTISGLIAGLAGSLAFAVLNMISVCGTAIAGGAGASIAMIILAMAAAYAYMVGFELVLGAIAGAVGGFAATKIGGKRGAQPQATAPTVAPPEPVKE